VQRIAQPSSRTVSGFLDHTSAYELPPKTSLGLELRILVLRLPNRLSTVVTRDTRLYY
jgi:hypothetical protein